MIITISDNHFMLSIAKIQRADSSYYTYGTPSNGNQLPYYEKDGRWDGAISELLGLKEKIVLKNDLDNIWAGKADPTNDFFGNRHSKVKNVAFDFTFSAPKSVSILFGLTEEDISSRIAESHENSVKTAFSYLERECSYIRRTEQKVQVTTQSKGLLGAQFLHRTSRANDPHLHTHLTIANLSMDGDKRWSALATRLLYGHIRNAGLLYHWSLRFDLSRNLGLEFTDSRPYADIIGLNRKIILSFSKRQQQIADELIFYDWASPQAKKIALYKSRPPKDFSTPYPMLQESWREEAFALGISEKKLHSLLHNQNHFFPLPNEANSKLHLKDKLLPENNTNVPNTRERAAPSRQENRDSDAEGGDKKQARDSEGRDPTLNPTLLATRHAEEHGRMLSDFQLTFSRKSLLTSCLLHVNDQLAVKDLQNAIDAFLSSPEIISLNENSRAKNIYRQIFDSGQEIQDGHQKSERRDPGQENIDRVANASFPDLKRSNLLRDSQNVYIHQKNLIILSQMADLQKQNRQKENNKTLDTNTGKNSKLFPGPIKIAIPADMADKNMTSFDPDNEEKNYPIGLGKKIPNREVLSESKQIILTYSKARAHLISATTGEETVSLEELLCKCKLESEKENKLFSVLSGYIRKNGITTRETGQKIQLDYRSKNFDRIRRQFEEKLSSSLSGCLEAKEVTYELSDNPIPLTLKAILDKRITSSQINFIRKIDLGSLLRENQKEHEQPISKRQLPGRAASINKPEGKNSDFTPFIDISAEYELESQYPFDATTRTDTLKRTSLEVSKSCLYPKRNDAAVSSPAHSLSRYIGISDQKKRVILVEDKQYFLDELKNNLEKLQNIYDHVILLADDSLELKSQKFQREITPGELQKSKANRYLLFGNQIRSDCSYSYPYQLRGLKSSATFPDNNYSFTLPQSKPFAPSITGKRAQPKGNLLLLNPWEMEKLSTIRRKFLDDPIEIKFSDSKRTGPHSLSIKSFPQINPEKKIICRNDSVCLLSIGIPTKIPPDFKRDSHIVIMTKPKFISEDAIGKYLEDFFDKSAPLQKYQSPRRTGDLADRPIASQVSTAHGLKENKLRNYKPALSKTDTYQGKDLQYPNRYLNNQNIADATKERSNLPARTKEGSENSKNHDFPKQQAGAGINYRLREAFEISL